MLRSARLLLIPCLALSGALSARAQETALPECTCRAHGQHFKLGANVCLSTPNGPRLAQCEMTQNITNWRFLDKGCDISGLTPSKQFSQLAMPAACLKPT